MPKSPATAAISAVEEPSQEIPVPSVSEGMESKENETPKETEEDIEAKIAEVAAKHTIPFVLHDLPCQGSANFLTFYSHEDVVIAVMGLTGTRKSTFIKYLTKINVKIGYSLKSCKITAAGDIVLGQTSC